MNLGSYLIGLTMLAAPWAAKAQQADPWTQQQLMEPAILARMIQDSGSNTPLILDVGPAGQIRGALRIGPTHERAGMKLLKKTLKKLPRDQSLVLYCGCCPFSHCPNIQPAFALVKKMGFTRARLLDLSHNLKMDWIDKGYPLQPQSP